MSQVPPELLTAAAAVGLTIEKVLRQTEKTLLAKGSLAGTEAAVKYLLDDDPFWAAKWRHELDVYEIFGEVPPPVRVPRLLQTDHERLLVLEWVDGRPVAEERYPQRSLTDAEVDAVLRCVTALNGWTAAAARFSPTFDYPERLHRYHDKGYLTDDELTALLRLVGTRSGPDQVNHGDPLASNILIGKAGDAVLLDWEFTGLFQPGFDLAMLHTQLGPGTPAVRERIDAIVAEAGIQESFAINLAVVLTRELRLHHELADDDPARIRCLPLIESAWAAARLRLHGLTTRRLG